MTAGIGHNGGPTIERGHRWRTFQWRRAQKAAMPSTIPLTIVRMRMARAAELGMDYKTYASVRQSAGRDILALLFSSNSLRIIADGARMPEDRTAHLAEVRGADRLAAVHPPHRPDLVLAANRVLTDAARAPLFTDSWSETRAKLGAFLRDRRLAADGVLIVGDTALEAEWLAAARAGAYLPSDRYFGGASPG